MNNFKLINKLFYNHSKTLFSKIPVSSKLQCRHCTIRRSVLYVPGDDLKKLQKAITLKVDCILMDCEDGVALNRKTEARETIRQVLDEGPVTKSDPEWGVRVNPVQATDLIEADLNVILSAKNLPACLCLPKINDVDQLQWFAEKVWNNLVKRPEDDRGPLNLIMLIESAIAMIRLPELCKKAEDLSTMAPLTPVALILGSDDLTASIGAVRSESKMEIFYARQKLVMVAKAFGLQAIDAVFLNYKSPKKFEEDCAEGVLLGYTGKQVIHPNQITIAQDVFVPSRQKIKWAKDIVKAFKENQEAGKGAFSFENMMIDMPTVKQAENVLKVAKTVGKYQE